MCVHTHAHSCTHRNANRFCPPFPPSFPSSSSLPCWFACAQQYLTQMVDMIEDRADEFGEVISAELGMPITLSTMVQVGTPVGVGRAMIEAVDDIK